MKDLVTMNQLGKLVTDSERLTIEDRVVCLVKLHHVLEMTVMLQQCLNLPHQLLCTAARSAVFSARLTIRGAPSQHKAGAPFLIRIARIFCGRALYSLGVHYSFPQKLTTFFSCRLHTLNVQTSKQRGKNFDG